MPIIAPSLLAANFLELGNACSMLNKSEAEWFHLDVMDGSFVPNISFGLPIIEQIRKATTKVCDVHLMIVSPENYISAFKKAGADILTVHYEACPELANTITKIKAEGMKAGVAINPNTDAAVLAPLIKEIDLVCVMSVYPGFGGQKFIETTYEKVLALKNIITNAGASTLIEIDGGVDANNAAALKKAGADVLVAGTTVFKAADPIAMISTLKQS
ncbi:MAG: ribulose-phosphate 3-epimerase [Chitinophagia bacterium]|jgi:ribulose-phosphate 3-epimerase|nr:ribulose-phosphate 3-epimerase [Chitinophagia bacterium]NCA30398.1 ribulose-phosphate 3-epimerase [Chitinophagia bacterium]NDD16891.1 ribulose-phosphate 3-epimerase [Chitinophagia bacterium]